MRFNFYIIGRPVMMWRSLSRLLCWRSLRGYIEILFESFPNPFFEYYRGEYTHRNMAASLRDMNSSAMRKYTPEQIQAEIDRPKRKGGRPKKYATEEEKCDAKRAASLRTYHRKKNAKGGIAITGGNAENDLALRKNMYNTDEERKHARTVSAIQYKRSHVEETRLREAVRYYTHRDA